MSEPTHAVRLKKPCQYLRYEPHQTLAFRWSKDGMPYDCQGGEFLTNDALVVDRRNVEEVAEALVVLGALMEAFALNALRDLA